jgi:Tol biopolymer transport system component
MTNFAARSSLRRVLLLGAAAAVVTAPAAHAAPGDLTPLAPVGAAAKVSADGQWAAYSAVGGNGKRQIFVRNVASGAVTPVTNGNDDSDSSATANGLGLDLSVDGRYVVFDSKATDLVPGLVDANAQEDVFRWDRTTGAIELVSAGPAGGTVTGASRQPHVSGDGRTVVFQSTAKLSAVDPGAFAPQVYVRDLAAGVTTMVSVTTAGAAANPFAERSDISADGRYVSFVSDAVDLVAGDVNGKRDVFRRDLVTGTTIAVTSGTDAADSPAINGDGSRVVFETFERLDPAADVNAADRDVYLRDITAGTTRLASLRDSLADDANESRGRDVSADGTRVPFDNGGVYVRDLVANAALTASANPTATFSTINGGGTFAGFLLGTGPQIGQLTAGNDVTAPALTFANGRVTVAADPSGVAQVLVGGAPVRLDANATAAVAASTAVEAWDGSGNRAAATSPADQTPPPPPPPPPAAAPKATKVKLSLERVRIGKRNRMLVAVRFDLSAAATARLEVRTQATKRRAAKVVKLGPKVARKAGRRVLTLTMATTPGRYSARIVLTGKNGATSKANVAFRIT